MAGAWDFLSCCPSLIDVLQFCKHNDILNCKLTNRRLNEVIHQNPLSLPRRKLLHVMVKSWIQGTKEYVRIGIDYRLIMFVTDGQIILERCHRAKGTVRSWHRLKDVVPTTYVKSQKDLTDGLLELVQTGFAETVTESYESGTIEEGLYKLFSFLLQRCSICSLWLGSLMQADWLNGLSLAFCDNRSSCNEIAATMIAPGLQELVRTSGCDELRLASSIWENGFLNNVITMSSWTSRCRYNKCLTQYDSIEVELLPVLQIWETAKTADEICLNGLQLTAPLEFPDGDNWNKFEQQSVDEMLEKLTNVVYETHFRKTDNTRIWKTFVERPLDKQVLTLTLTHYSSSQKRNSLFVEEGRIFFTESDCDLVRKFDT